jgi:hypothetical protein
MIGVASAVASWAMQPMLPAATTAELVLPILAALRSRSCVASFGCRML